jgi:hypothetical protein
VARVNIIRDLGTQPPPISVSLRLREPLAFST